SSSHLATLHAQVASLSLDHVSPSAPDPSSCECITVIPVVLGELRDLREFREAAQLENSRLRELVEIFAADGGGTARMESSAEPISARFRGVDGLEEGVGEIEGEREIEGEQLVAYTDFVY
ncbi:hypothetical protein HDU93_004430, partial [Gonapodya sp. JEL0774]